MRFYIQSFDQTWDVNPTIGESILKHLPCVDAIGLADAVIVVVCYKPNYRFHPQLMGITKPIVLLDFTEYGWDAGDKNNVLGTGMTQQFGHLAGEEWGKLDDWVGSIYPLVHFKRELFAKDKSDRLLPIEFPCMRAARPIQTKEEFDARSLEVFNCWGLSHPIRQKLHGDIFRNAHDCGINVIDSWAQDDHFEGRSWATIHSPHYDRKPIEYVMQWNHKAKISVSLPGAGIKCFRSAESPVGSIMALQGDDLAWSIPWEHGVNCLRLETEDSFGSLLRHGWKDDYLFDIYRVSQETIAKYRAEAYTREYVLPAIKERL